MRMASDGSCGRGTASGAGMSFCGVSYVRGESCRRCCGGGYRDGSGDGTTLYGSGRESNGGGCLRGAGSSFGNGRSAEWHWE